MIFRPRLARAVADGRKTQTRRVVTDADQTADVPRFTAGQRLPVQPGRGRTMLCRIVLTDVRQEPLGAITFQDARAEGFRTRDEFFVYWRELHQLGLSDHQTDLLHRLHDGGGVLRRDVIHPGLNSQALTGRLRHLHNRGLLNDDGTWVELTDDGHEALHIPAWGIDTDQLVWVLTFRVDTEHRPLLLHRDSTRGYTHDPAHAVPHEPEAIHPDQLDPRWTTDAEARRHAARLDQDLQHLARQHSEEARLAHLQQLARDRGIDIRDKVRVVEKHRQAQRRRLDAIERELLDKHTKSAAA